MARGDGKVRHGRTRGQIPGAPPKTTGVKRMATGGFAASSREGGFAGAGTSRLESPGQRSSVSPGGGNISAGNVPGGGRGGSDRQTPSGRPSGASVAGQSARLGPNAAAAMTQAGIDSGRAQMLAGIMNSLQDTRPASIRGTEIQSLTPGGKIADRIEPTMGYIPQPDFLRTIGPRPATTSTGMRSGYLDQQSIVPGTVSFTQQSKQVPFAQTPTGQSLLARSKQPLTRAEAEALAKQLPAGTKLSGNFFGASLAGFGAPDNPSAYNQYPATIEGRSFNVNVPTGAMGNMPFGPKVGTFNPAPAPKPTANKPITDRIEPGGTKQFYDRLPQGEPAAPKSAPASVVASPKTQSFTAADRPFEGGNRGDRDKPRKKKPIIEEEVTTAKHGGLMGRGDGKAYRGKTKGRYI